MPMPSLLLAALFITNVYARTAVPTFSKNVAPYIPQVRLLVPIPPGRHLYRSRRNLPRAHVPTRAIIILPNPVRQPCEILYRLPNLSHLWSVFEGPTTLILSVALPNLTRMSIGYSHSHKWLQRFSGASLNKLTSVTFYADSPRTQVNGFLEEFERVALSTSIPTTLLTFAFHAPSP
jgi:hypothetical protein